MTKHFSNEQGERRPAEKLVEDAQLLAQIIRVANDPRLSALRARAADSAEASADYLRAYKAVEDEVFGITENCEEPALLNF